MSKVLPVLNHVRDENGSIAPKRYTWGEYLIRYRQARKVWILNDNEDEVYKEFCCLRCLREYLADKCLS